MNAIKRSHGVSVLRPAGGGKRRRLSTASNAQQLVSLPAIFR
jgi:hypothetical protein